MTARGHWFSVMVLEVNVPSYDFDCFCYSLYYFNDANMFTSNILI